MTTTTLKGIKIDGISAAVSNTRLTIEEMKTPENAAELDQFQEMVGVRGRWAAEHHQTTADFCAVAARELLAKKGVDPSEVGILVFVTQTADYSIPATACVLQMRLGLPKESIAFDVNLGCSGFVYGLSIAGTLLQNSNAKYALLLCGDTSGKERDPNHPIKTTNSARFLFGDSGTATLLKKDDSAEDISSAFCTDGNGFKAIIAPYSYWRNPKNVTRASRMDDIAVFNFTISEVPRLIKSYMAATETTEADYDALVLHQANQFILKQVAKRAKFPWEKVPLSISEYSNTSSSSIPITLVHAYGDKTENKELKPLMCGFGIGLSWGVLSAKVNQADILPIIHTSEYFADGYQDADEYKNFIDPKDR